MKKTVLLFSLCAIALGANAQLALTGTSYTQNFNSLTAGPSSSVLFYTEWSCYAAATSSSLGSADATVGLTYSPSTDWGTWSNDNGTDTATGQCPSDIFGHGFKNCASNDAGAAITSDGCSQQEAVTNRALGVRQVGSGDPGYDPGIAFCLQIANTSARTSFHATFNLESLDTLSPRVTTWTVDYGFGASPTTFTTVTTSPATITTGGNTFANTPVTINFGTALDNQSGPVWIRIDALTASTGTGDRATSAIDDFNLTWTGSGTTGITNVSAAPALSLTAIGIATSDNITLAYNAEEAGNYNLGIYDLTGRAINTRMINAQQGTQHISVDGLNLAPGMYIAKMSNGNSSSVARIMVK